MARPKSVKRRVVEGIADFAVGALPDALEAGARRALGMPSLAVPRRAAPARPLALPAPPRQLALPAPGPGLPSYASKPRGGQWWIDKEIADGNSSPEAAARTASLNLALSGLRPEREGVIAAAAPSTSTAGDWLERALAKYYKTDFGSPDDPLRGLAERGLHYDPEMTPEKWQSTVNSYLLEDPIESVLFPPNRAGGMPGAGSNFRGEVMVAMPWLAKAPVTDKIYGISSGGLDLGHFTDEFYNALNPELSGLPMDLAVRPESLNRMTFPQAVERVGRINQFRAKEMERAALSNLDSPAVQTFKEYPENNPMGLRWTELRAPEAGAPLPAGWFPDGKGFYNDNTGETQSFHPSLKDALKYEGDTMGHCVGGYCDDVATGRSRIFSLRDAKGEPHVTIETSPSRKQYFFRDVRAAVGDDQADDWLNEGLKLSEMVERAGLREGNLPEDIVHIKGKQNRAPKDDYLPFVQDFVKSGQWGNVGDLGNTGLVRLPDGRYITQQQLDAATTTEALSAAFPLSVLKDEYYARTLRDPNTWDAEDWEKLAPNFEGYAIGGRVDRNRCFSRHPLSAR